MPYTFEDLQAWDKPGVHLGVLGHPIAHSLSPQMHGAALAEFAREDASFARWEYHLFDIPAERLPEALPLFYEKGFAGMNLTVPHKVEVLPHLVGYSPMVERIGAANTLVRKEGGYFGENTDIYGIAKTLEQAWAIESLAKTPVILVGAGGAARAAAILCLHAGCCELWIGNRSQDRLEALLQDLRAFRSQTVLHGFDLTQALPRDLPKTGVLIQSTSLGIQPGDPAPIDLSTHFEPSLKVFDMIYNPLPTPTMKAALSAGMDVCGGLLMLIYQGVLALEHWSGRKPSAAIMLETVERILKERSI